MKKSELPLYLKISPIYNKILQLAIAVICIVVLMNVLIHSQNQHKSVISKHFSDFSKSQITQAVSALKILIVDDNKQGIKNYIQALAKTPFVQDVHFYDKTGQLIVNSDSEQLQSINHFFNQHQQAATHRKQYQTFVQEIITTELVGYLRITIDEKAASKPLETANFDLHETMRLLALFAVVIGFFLTRGFSRFSRQGFRVAK